MARVARTAGQETTNGLLIRLVREATLWVLGAMALIMLLALLTYDPRDPGFSHTGDGGMLHNQIGAAGAWFADFAYYLCGLPAFLFPAMMLLAGWVVFSERTNPRPMEKKVMITRFGGFVIMLLTSCGLATLHFVNQEMRESAGGVLGKMVGTGLEGVLGLLGATLLLLALWLAAVSLFTGISWLAVMDRIGYWVLRGGDATRLWLKELRDRAMAQRVLKETPANDASRITHAFRLATARAPKPAELKLLTQRIQQLRASYAKDEAATTALLTVGEFKRDEKLNATDHAAYTVLCNLILNLDEVITRE